ncbi:hypothetical protein [Corynebacterium sp. A21]|uniref:hypothetical protein n=1 Tax=Corynebacterium sp. A21 TaxID=3457318 RepID=UPI003FD209A0
MTNSSSTAMATKPANATDYQLTSVIVSSENRTPVTVEWHFIGTAPLDAQVTYGITAAGKNVLARITGSTVDQVSYWDGSRNVYVDSGVMIHDDQVIVAIPPKVADAFVGEWLADLQIDGQKVNECKRRTIKHPYEGTAPLG